MKTAGELRQLVANVASNEYTSTDASRYWRVVLPPTWRGPYPKHWCGAFALWSLKTALGCPWHWDFFPNGEGKGFLWRLPKTKTPDLGDVCYMAQPYQHHAILTAIGTTPEGFDYVISQDGNSGASPGECLEQWRHRNAWTAFYSIEPAIQACINERW